MPQTSFALMTTIGRAKEAAALANATTITITQIAIGDGATVPSGGETALYHEVARKTISGHGTVVGADNVAYFDCYLAAGDGPYTIREAGLYDDTGALIAIAHYDPPINKPVPESGQTVDATVRLEVAFSNVASIIIVIDPAMKVALQRLTRLPWIPIISMSLAAPPLAPAVGDTYLIPTAPTGAWAGQDGKIAEFTIVGWAMITPPDGHGVSLPDGRVFERVAGIYVEKIAIDSQAGKWTYAAVGGTANALTAVLAPAPLALAAGMALRLKIAATNTGPVTLALNTFGTASVIRKDGRALDPGSLVAGQIADLVYDGASWQVAGLTGGVGPFAIGKIVLLSASGTYTPSPGVRALLVAGIGGGGAGGGATALTTGIISIGGGGGSGGYFKILITAPAPSYTVTIGGGGASVVGNAGSAGGTTSFGSVASAVGGYGGSTVQLSSPGNSAAPSGAGGGAVGGDINAKGTSGAYGFLLYNGGAINGVAGNGGGSIYGGGGLGSQTATLDGSPGSAFGAGGGGGVINATGLPSRSGGAGADGCIEVWELF